MVAEESLERFQNHPKCLNLIYEINPNSFRTFSFYSYFHCMFAYPKDNFGPILTEKSHSCNFNSFVPMHPFSN